MRINQYKGFLLKPLWAVETLIFVVLIMAFLIRDNPVDRAKGLEEVMIPVIGALLPFLLLFSPPAPWIWKSRSLTLAVFWWMTLSTGLTVWGMWTLRRAFSITVEARSLISKGPYRWIRHPIYFGEILTAGAVAAWRFSWPNLLVLVCFVVIQLFRAKMEEGKLERSFPEYNGFRERTWWFF
jgi:protein-S-isoprenylcysteine O-methyltransferase Ste14